MLKIWDESAPPIDTWVMASYGVMDNVNGFDIKDTKIKDKRKALRNTVDPDIGLHILNCAMNIQQPVNFGLFEEVYHE